MGASGLSGRGLLVVACKDLGHWQDPKFGMFPLILTVLHEDSTRGGTIIPIKDC